MTKTASQKFIEALGLMTQVEGGSRIAGQLLAYLILAGEPRSLTRIAEDLGVSKASISTNARQLELRGLTRRVAEIGTRQDLWEVAPDPGAQVLKGLSERLRHNYTIVEGIAQEFPDEDRETRERVSAFGTFYRDSADFLDEWENRVGSISDAKKTD